MLVDLDFVHFLLRNKGVDIILMLHIKVLEIHSLSLRHLGLEWWLYASIYFANTKNAHFQKKYEICSGRCGLPGWPSTSFFQKTRELFWGIRLLESLLEADGRATITRDPVHWWASRKVPGHPNARKSGQRTRRARPQIRCL